MSDDVEEALGRYQAARDRMNALHEEYVAVLGRPDQNVTEARVAFDEAEDQMRRLRRVWWMAVAWERQNPS